MSPHIVDCGGAAVDVGEAPESAVGADRDVVRNAKEAMSDRRILTQRKAENQEEAVYIWYKTGRKRGERD